MNEYTSSPRSAAQSLTDILAERRRLPNPVGAHGRVPSDQIRPQPLATYEPFPLTEIQQAYWIGRQAHLELGGISTHGYSETDSERIDPANLQTAFNRLIARHGMLRAVVDEGGTQRIKETVDEYRVKFADLTGRSAAEIDAHIQSTRAELSHQIFTLGQWPMFELRLTQLPGGRSRLHFSIDLMLLDDTSIRLLFAELKVLLDNPDAVDVATSEVTYRDYALFQQQQHENREYQKAQNYWHRRIEMLSPPPDLPTLANVTHTGTPNFTSRVFRLTAAEQASLAAKAARTNVTITAAVLTLFSEVLRRWSKTPHFTLNLTTSDRPPIHEDVERLLGNFTSLMLLDINDPPGESFLNRTRTIQAQMWEIMENRAYSGISVLRDIAHRNGDFTSAQMPVVFTSTLTAGSAAVHANRAGLGKKVFTTSQTPQVRLDHQLFEDDDELVFNWDSVDQEFPEGMLDDMFSTYERLVRDVVSGDTDWNQRLPYFLPEPQAEARTSYNDTAAEIPDGLLHYGFLQSVQRLPDNVAVITSQDAWTYEDLWSHTNRLAAQLRAAGITRGECVAVAMPKGPEQIVAVLASLLEGAAYLPMDMRWPPARRDLVLKNAGARIILTCGDADLTNQQGIPVITVSMSDPVPPLPLPEILPIRGDSTDIAYIIYTSGSTGTPKGVVIDHQAALNTVSAIVNMQEIGEGDRFIALSELSFDLSIYDIFGALSTGAALVIPNASDVPDIGHWAQLTRDHQVTIWNSVPTLLEMYVDFLEANPSYLPSSMRFAMASGDWIPLGLPGKLKRLLPAVRMWSLGGATEAAIWSIYYPIDEIDPGWPSIPYGRPLRNQTIHVLDYALNPRPLHVVGDLYIGGVGVAKGYWNDPERTEKQFVKHPDTGEILYKTGDLGRFMDNATVQFLGRADNQVKLSGFRVELGEIEAQMDKVEGVARSVCLVVAAPRGQRRLVAYLVPESPDNREDDSGCCVTETIEGTLNRLEFKLTHPGRRVDLEGPHTSLVLDGNDPCGEDNPRYFERRSFRKYTGEAVELEHLSALLRNLARTTLSKTGLPKARYGSAGGLYPVQCYLSILLSSDATVTPGHYYYDPHQHELIGISSLTPSDASIFGDCVRSEGAVGMEIVLAADLNAITPLYGELSAHFATLEAGMMTQLLETDAPLHGLGICQAGWIDEAATLNRFQLGSQYQVLHGLVCGRIDRTSRGVDGYFRDNADHFELLRQLRGHIPPPVLKTPVRLEDRVKAALTETLPPYMHPSRFEILAQLPLTTNCKVDRSNLPLPCFEGDAPQTDGHELTRSEQTVVKILRDVIGVDQFRTDENFFDLGADSLTLVRIHSRLQEALNHSFPIVEVFRKPTVLELCAFLFPDEVQGRATDERISSTEDIKLAKSRLQSRRNRLSQMTQ